MDPRLWRPDLRPEDAPKDDTFGREVHSVNVRLRKLRAVEENPGNHTGPMVGSALVDDNKTAWFATRYGATVGGLPWRFRSSINPQFAAHAMMAADVGMQVETMGMKVLSERELASRTDKHGDEVTTDIESFFYTSTGSKVGKKPDLAVLSRDGRSFHAIEVERDRDRAASTYAEKLRAYDDNPAIKGVWYLCAYEATANRVKAAASRVFGDRPFPLRVRVLEDLNGWSGIPGLERDEALISDLRRLT